MKRVHSGDSALVPYDIRNNSCTRDKNTNAAQPSGPNVFLDKPYEIISQIFALLSVKNQFLMNLVCKQWHRILSSDIFGSLMLINAGLTSREGLSCLKTYHLWLKTETYIMLDCSDSMDKFTAMSMALVKEIAEKVFQNQWFRGVKLGIFSGRYHFRTFYGKEELETFLVNLNTIIDQQRLNTKQSKVIPLLDKFYYQIDIPQRTRNTKAPEALMHLITDCALNELGNVSNWVARKTEAKPYKPITFNVYWLKEEKSEPNRFTKRIARVEANQQRTDKFQVHMQQKPLVTKKEEKEQ